MKINILDSSVYNRIAAGEVVENPASIVKELVENAIDAGATSISISIEDGGIKSICVTDNGSGIEREELPKTILAHATSKICEADDLNTISTLGFRGEALASIAAVSEMEILTCAAGEDCGSLLRSKDGNLTITDAASNVGTSVKVKNLFYNTPARYKFLSSKTAEENYIARYVSQFILANPNIAIEFFSDDSLIYSSSGSGLESAIQAVFFPNVYENLIKIEPCSNTANITVSGYITPPSVFKNNRTQQTVVLNGRIVFDQTISATVQNAYGERLMGRCFPIFVLNIIMPFDEVDVNVHPNKREVRFSNSRQVYGAIYRSVKQALDLYEENSRKELLDDFCEKSNENARNQTKNNSIGGAIGGSEKSKTIDENTSTPYVHDPNWVDPNSLIRFTIADACEILNGGIARADRVELSEPPIVSAGGSSHAPVIDTINSSLPETSTPKSYDSVSAPVEMNKEERTLIENMDLWTNNKKYKVIGQIFDTYLIIESAGKVLFIDQHAMHERILFDEFTEALKRSEIAVQPLMLPYVFESNVETTGALLDATIMLSECGFEIEPFGRTAIKITTVPAMLGEVNLQVLMTEIAEGLKVGKMPALTAITRRKLASMACKAAIKGGASLTEAQIYRMMDVFAKGKLPLQCPHGRPTAVVYSKYDFERLFRRKV